MKLYDPKQTLIIGLCFPWQQVAFAQQASSFAYFILLTTKI